MVCARAGAGGVELAPMRTLAAALVATSLSLAACGDSSDDEPTARGASTAAGGIAGKPAEEILAEAAKAMGKVRSYHVEGTQTDEDGPMKLKADVSADGRSRISFTLKSQRVELIVLDDESYMKADKGFWKTQGGGGGEQLGELLADKWVRTPGRDAGGLSEAVEQLLPSTLAYCFTKGTGTITKKGTGEVGGKPVVILQDDGKTPGGSPGDLYVAQSGAPLPVRMVQTGRQTPGKPDPRCGDDDSTTTKSDIRLSNYDEPVKITAPRDALDLDEIAQGGGGTQSN